MPIEAVKRGQWRASGVTVEECGVLFWYCFDEHSGWFGGSSGIERVEHCLKSGEIKERYSTVSLRSSRMKGYSDVVRRKTCPSRITGGSSHR